jgi:rhamnosyltransferase
VKADQVLSELGVVTVLYEPDIDVLLAQLAQLPAASPKVWVDNASSLEKLERIRQVAAARPDLTLLENAENLGLARAINQGAARLADDHAACRYLLLLDQDTEPGEGGAEALLGWFSALARTHPRLACIGPTMVDVDTGLTHGFHQIAGWRWVRRYPDTPDPLPVANLNGSGTLVPVDIFMALGGLAEDLFIDHVDTEWSFRVLAARYQHMAIPSVSFRHRMGARGIRFWFGAWRVWPYRSPARHFYLFRNSVHLLRSPDVPWVWKLWAPPKLLLTLVAHLVADNQRWRQARAMVKGARAGLSNPHAWTP